MSITVVEHLHREGIRINEPKYRGAPTPMYSYEAINVCDFEDENRAKNVDINIDPIRNVVTIDWISQEYSDSYDMFKQEIKRYFEYIKEIYGEDDDSIITVIVKIHDRDGIGGTRFTLEI